jgi:hypothetical protein
MDLDLSADDIAALEIRTEGWIAGLQMAALSMQGRADTASFIQAFTGSHRFVLDYLVEEVLQRQPEHVRSFLLQTSILDRLCSSLCDAVRFGFSKSPSSSKGTAVTGQLPQKRCGCQYRCRTGRDGQVPDQGKLHQLAAQKRESLPTPDREEGGFPGFVIFD